ncbi:hypothetical protein CAPTEDRAFT_123626 [Capitella teleta]|uniref:Serpin domain-containing protein n=1 Tax=Capitella teleta TaxID=283909 RepID=R7U527_CAPTE|nr:hypothetical protein CAPTEDRAFT_123626 [Capitella teleta]|eukprot:ELU01231.1 hypothetical protein CAPTEDRAFT_123626 [Capitella teleta]
MATPATVSNLADSSNVFAKDMYLQIARNNDGQNLLFAPLGLSMAMAMVYNGAVERTERQIFRTMYFDVASDSKEELNQLNYDIMRLFKKPTNQYTLSFANKLFGSRQYEYNRDFKQVLMQKYSAPLEKMDLSTDVEDAVQHINNWVSERTNMIVTDMLKEGDISTNMSLVLISAFSIRGIWQESFPKENTKERPFLKGGIENIDVQTMYTEANFSYKAMPEMKSNVLGIPYAGDTVSLFVVLPWNRTHGMEELETAIRSSNSLDGIFEGLQMTSMKVSLPLLNLTKSVDLAGNLTNLGIDDLFVGHDAQLGGITSSPDVHVSLAEHKTFFSIREQGELPREPTNGTKPDDQDTLFLANHPFMFFVRESTTGAILQMGRVADPSAGATHSAVMSCALLALALFMSLA